MDPGFRLQPLDCTALSKPDLACEAVTLLCLVVLAWLEVLCTSPLCNAWQDEMIAYVRRKSAAFSRGRSKYRGVSGQSGRWEARIGAYCGRKNVSSFFYCCHLLSMCHTLAYRHTSR